MERLNNHVRFRIDDDYILLCNCDTMQIYNFPYNCLSLLNRLSNGIDISKIELSNYEQDILSDLSKIGCLESSKKVNNKIIWDIIGYSEREFI